jgi:cellulose synthase/poly-beta-1,6-N-acetylglucosamine synthase-like glycosyltransferase
MNKWIRQTHRWLSIAFTVTVIANFVAIAQADGGTPPAWVTYSPLLPLFLLLFSGLYLFALPYAARWRGARRAG